MLDGNILKLPGARRALAVCFACAVASAGLILGQAVSLALSISAAWAHDVAGSVSWAVVFAVCYAARHLVVFGRDSFMGTFALQATDGLRKQALLGLYDAGADSLRDQGRGSTVALLSEGLAQVQTYLGIIIPKVADMMAIPALVGVVLLFIDVISGVIALVLIPCVVFYMRMLGSYSKEKAAAQRAQYNRLANRFSDSLLGASSLIAFGAQQREADEIFTQGEKLREKTVATLKAATLSSLVLDLFSVFALAAVAIMLGFRLLSGDVALTPALIVLIAVPEMFAVIRRYSSDFHASLDGRNSLAALLELADGAREGESAEAEGSPALAAGTEDGASSRIAFKHVGFCYPNAEDARRPASLADIDFDVSAPLKIGIVGESGAGKSTLVSLLAGLAEPSTGVIKRSVWTSDMGCNEAASEHMLTADEWHEHELTADEWRRRVLLIPQSPTIFSATLAENVAFYKPDATAQQIEQALEAAGLTEVVDALPQGMDTLIGNGGRSVSGGQAQRIALARGFLCDSRDVLIFDEPTAHLDIQTELALKPAMLKLMDGKLCFVATHRLHWMRDMDAIVVLEAGRIVQAGPLAELEGAGGAYDRLAARLRGVA